jgi:multiple sugar transport system ATP-binding protein
MVQQFGTPEEIYTRPANRFVAEFIGSPTMNFVTAERQQQGLRAQGVTLPVSAQQQASIDAAITGNGGCLYGLRPEHIRLADDGVPGKLVMIEPTGPETYLLVDTPLGQITSRVAGNPHLNVGDAVRLQWAAESAHLFDASSEKRLA